MRLLFRYATITMALFSLIACEKRDVEEDPASKITLDLKAQKSSDGFIVINGSTTFDFTLGNISKNKTGIVVWCVDEHIMPLSYFN